MSSKLCNGMSLRHARLLLLAGALTSLPLAAQSVQQTPQTGDTPADSTKTPSTKSVEAAGKAAQNGSKLTTVTDSNGEEVQQMEVFEVTHRKDQGYMATNTMSGTRLNSSLDDLAASISVVTKDQLMDTASSDINDIFRYEASTEGTYQFTDITVDSSKYTVTDNASNSPETATRMRGLGAANIARNNFASSLPIDRYNIDSVEISKGPNSSVFGLGNTGGSVNLVGSRASFDKDFTRVEGAYDSYDGYRSAINLNRVVFRGLLGVRLDAMYQNKGYERKPSADRTQRYTFSATFRPFKKTTIRASSEHYTNFNNRPNTITPKDVITDWIAHGRPTWDPTTNTAHVNGSSVVIDMKTSSAANYETKAMPLGLSTSNSAFYGPPSLYIDDGKAQLFTTSAAASSSSIYNVGGYNRMIQLSSDYNRNASTLSNANALYFYTKGITNKDLYDWTSINLNTANVSRMRASVSDVELEQIIVESGRQTLALQAGIFKERLHGSTRYVTTYSGGNSPADAAVQIDINEKLMDGTPNPYFLRPYVGGASPSTSKQDQNNDNYRLTGVWKIDFSHDSGWRRWLGSNTFVGYAEYKATEGGKLSYVDAMASNPPWMATTSTSFTRKNTTYYDYQRYYLGGAGSFVQHAPTPLANPLDTYSLHYQNGVTGQWTNQDVTYGEFYMANRRSKNDITTYGGVWQGNFLDSMIIPTAGWRFDVNKNRSSNSAGNPSNLTNGFYDLSPLYQYGNYDWVIRKGHTDSKGVVVRPFKWISLRYNESNSFNPSSLVYDINGNPLPDPHGTTRDYGFSLNLFKNKLYLKYTQYETNDFGRGNSNTLVNRILRLDDDGSATGDAPDLYSWLMAEFVKAHPDWSSDQMNAGTMALMGVDPAFIDSHRNKTHDDYGNARSQGREIELNYNPNRYWTLKASATQTKAFNSAMSPLLQAYIDKRMPYWTSVKSPYDGSYWWTSTYTGSTSASGWYYTNILAPMKLATATQGKQRSQTREWRATFVSRYQLAGITNNRYLRNVNVGGAARWEDRAVIGYKGTPADADGYIRGYDANSPIYDKAHTYYDAFATYSFKLFHDRVGAKVQVNVENIFENGRLQPIAVNPDGSPYAFRIVDPRKFTLTVSFDL